MSRMKQLLALADEKFTDYLGKSELSEDLYREAKLAFQEGVLIGIECEQNKCKKCGSYNTDKLDMTDVLGGYYYVCKECEAAL